MTRFAYLPRLFEEIDDVLWIFPWDPKNSDLVWKQSWRKLNLASYGHWISSRIITAREDKPSLLLMQNAAPCSSSWNIMEASLQAGAEPIMSPPFFLDLNLIKSVRILGIDDLQARYAEFDNGRQISQRTLKRATREAWHSISSDELGRLVASMSACLQDARLL